MFQSWLRTPNLEAGLSGAVTVSEIASVYPLSAGRDQTLTPSGRFDFEIIAHESAGCNKNRPLSAILFHTDGLFEP